ncbi:hypothetical protein C8Q77DRAFT_1156616 [Trametes polyzona]|nr:hypothetical protein C8Q77DRAFT_1156616 [Trametes polyzona]
MNESGALVESMRVILHDLQSSSATIYAASNDVSQQLRHTLDEIQANVEGALHELVAATSALAPAIYEALSVNVERVSSLMTTRLQNINELSDRAGSQIMNLENHLEDMQRDVRLLIGDTWVAGDLLQVHLRQSVTTQEKQLEIARSTDNVAAALNRIVDKAHAEILQINDTAAAMKESLLKSSSNDWSVVTWSWLEAALMYSFRYLWKDDHAPLQLPGVHALVFFSRVVWWFLGLTSSGLMFPATIKYTAPDGSVREREVCKSTASGQCPKGDRCRYAHLTDEELDRYEASLRAGGEKCDTLSNNSISETTSESPDAGSSTNASNGTLTQHDTSQPASEAAAQPREVCRLYFRKNFCPRRRCKRSHDILDLARLPPDNTLVRKNADKIRETLEKLAAEEAASAAVAAASNPSQPTSAVVMAKKRQKKTRKSGSEGPSPEEPTSNGSNIRAKPLDNKGKGKAREVSVCAQGKSEYGAVPALSASERAKRPSKPASASQQPAPNDGDSTDESYYSAYGSITGSLQGIIDTANDTSREGDTLMTSIQRPPPAVPPGLGLEKLVNKQPMAYPPAVLKAPPVAQPRVTLDTMTITVVETTRVTFGPGFAIQQIVTGFETRQIIVEGVPADVVPASVTTELSTFGTVAAVAAVDSGRDEETITYKVTFASGEAATEAVAALNGKERFGVKISARLAQKKSAVLGGGVLCDGDVLFELPGPWQIGFVGYPTEELAAKGMALASRSTITLTKVVAEPFQGVPNIGAYNVRFFNLPPTFTVDDVKKHFVDRIDNEHDGKKSKRRGKGKGKARDSSQQEQPQTQPAEEKSEGVMIQPPKYTSLQAAIQGLVRMLKEYDEGVTINVLPPPYRKFFRVWAHFTNPDAAVRAYEGLNRFCPRFVGKQRIFAHHAKTIRYQLPTAVFDILAHDINLLRSYLHDDNNTTISVLDKSQSLGPGAPITVKLAAQTMPALTKAKTAFDRLLRGEKVTDNGQIVWDEFFAGPSGEGFLRELEHQHPRIKITSDRLRRTLTLFGIQQERERVREAIIRRVRLIKSQLIRRYPVAGHLIGVFMSEDLIQLQQELGHENVWFDLAHQELAVRGNADAQKVAQLAVLHTQQRLPRRTPPKGEAACPVCFGEVSHPVTLACGHTWCKACLTGYLNASVDTKTFPLGCLADSARCAAPIPLVTAQRLLSTEEFDAIVHAAFIAYVQARPQEYHYCPTPDCPQVYRKVPHAAAVAGAGVLQCPSCLVRICAHCNTEAHESTSCQDENLEDDALFEQWKLSHDVKDCPSCKVPIERSAGCNHMTCASCRIHICWACLATFSRSEDVYDHMRSIHGGIGL